jgi:predicted metal-dependent HD superfamily phosphohydrolase
MSLERRRFRSLIARLGGRAADDVFADLVTRYGEPHRHYHGTAHLVDCLARFDEATSLADRPDEIELALWFHDAIHEPLSADNEARSATLARDSALAMELGEALAGRLAELVLLTRHDRDPDPRDLDAALLLDVDLSILGREPAEFDAYERAIRREYAAVADEAFRAGRRRVLESFLARPMIYRTGALARRWETPARRNLERSLLRLSSAPLEDRADG